MSVPIPVLAYAVAGPLLFVVSFLVQGALRDDGCSPLRGLFLCDPSGGHPPGTPAVAVVRTWHGVAHDICSTPVFTALPAACLVAARRFARAGDHGLARISAAAGTATLALFVVTGIGFAQSAGLGPVAGLMQRLTIAVGFLWIAVFARRRSLTPA
ncbi:MAG: DUF998 domain-containing protein [Pseudonocardia sp.]|uniref:DUF998 domain-containing protein n=1 Tax=unclassified Pseudonocardia TaxID=2619320 RepID=UPI001ACA2620|nr:MULTISPECIES: DUF998 domain-containing protein [unclassified Pseudonocardia]MBN9112777.1 DUF998 domain-containing protein [Pseudonocardia sp.]